MNYIDPLAKLMGGMVVEYHGLFDTAQGYHTLYIRLLRGVRTLDERAYRRA